MTSTCINKRSSYTITCQLLDLTCLSFQNYLLNDSIALVISREKGINKHFATNKITGQDVPVL